jgi:hypothetical protein
VVEQGRRHVQVSVTTTGALVHDRCSGGLAVGGNLNLLEAVGTGVAAAVLRSVQGDDKVRVGRDLSTCTET